MAPSFVHHAPIPGIAPGPEGMKPIGHFVFSQIGDIEVTLVHRIAEVDLVCSRVSASGTMKETGQTVSWTENHFYRVDEGKIIAWWGEGGPPLS